MHTQRLQEIAKSRKSFNELMPYPEKLYNCTNCYAFALGLTYPGNDSSDYIPGFTADKEFCEEKTIIDYVKLDLTNLKIEFEFHYLELFAYKALHDHPERYLIKVFFSEPSPSHPHGDFHFLRCDNNKKWFHKPGWFDPPLLTQGFEDIYPSGIDPDSLAFTDSTTGEITRYQPLGYFSIKN